MVGGDPGGGGGDDEDEDDDDGAVRIKSTAVALYWMVELRPVKLAPVPMVTLPVATSSSAALGETSDANVVPLPSATLPLACKVPMASPGASVPLVTLIAPTVPVPLSLPPATVTGPASEPMTVKAPAFTVVAPV